MSTKASRIVSVLLVFIGVIGRLIPHVPNLTPMMAIALFSTTYLGLRYSLFVFVSTMFVADIVIGLYQWQIMLAVYACFMTAAGIGLWIKKYKSISVIAIGTVASSLLFFLVTNWAVWQFSGMYEHSRAGLWQCYIMALPFFRNSLVGDLLYTGIFFGVYELARMRYTMHKNVYSSIVHYH
jgi:hypothetical protein